jgi:hypothetical protein
LFEDDATDWLGVAVRVEEICDGRGDGGVAGLFEAWHQDGRQ